MDDGAIDIEPIVVDLDNVSWDHDLNQPPNELQVIDQFEDAVGNLLFEMANANTISDEQYREYRHTLNTTLKEGIKRLD
jgi:hypothetical protein